MVAVVPLKAPETSGRPLSRMFTLPVGCGVLGDVTLTDRFVRVPYGYVVPAEDCTAPTVGKASTVICALRSTVTPQKSLVAPVMVEVPGGPSGVPTIVSPVFENCRPAGMPTVEKGENGSVPPMATGAL